MDRLKSQVDLKFQTVLYLNLFGNFHLICIFRHLIQPASRMPMALSQHFEGGLTDIEMANGLNVYDFDDTFEDERAFEMEYEVSFHNETN